MRGCKRSARSSLTRRMGPREQHRVRGAAHTRGQRLQLCMVGVNRRPEHEEEMQTHRRCHPRQQRANKLTRCLLHNENIRGRTLCLGKHHWRVRIWKVAATSTSGNQPGVLRMAATLRTLAHQQPLNQHHVPRAVPQHVHVKNLQMLHLRQQQRRIRRHRSRHLLQSAENLLPT